MGKRARKPTYRPYSVGKFRLGWLVDQFCCVWHEAGRRHRHRLGVTDESQARTELHAFAAQALKLAELNKNVAITWGKLHNEYVADREQEGKDTRRQGWLLTPLNPVFGHLRPEDIDRRICRDYERDRLAKGRRPHTVYGELNHVRTVLNWAAKNKLIKLDELPNVYVPPMPEPRDRHLIKAEIQKLLDAAEFPHIRLFLILALSTAARKTAILDLTWDRVDFERGLIQLHDPERQRTSKGRATVPMNATARAALLEAKLASVSNCVIEWAGKRVRDVKRGVSTAFVKAGLKVKGDGAHVLRHTAAVIMAEAGVDLAEIAQYLGHADLRTTYRIYARFSPTYLQKAASSLDLPAVRSSAR